MGASAADGCAVLDIELRRISTRLARLALCWLLACVRRSSSSFILALSSLMDFCIWAITAVWSSIAFLMSSMIAPAHWF